MNGEFDERTLRDIATLSKVETFHTIFMAKLEEAKVTFRDQADDHFIKAIRLLPFPDKGSRVYYFTIHKELSGGKANWEPVIKDKKVHIPWEAILPYDLIREISQYPVDSSKTLQLDNIKYRGNEFKICFIKYLEDSVVGIIHKLNPTPGSVEESESPIDVSQYLLRPEEEQIDIFMGYFNAYPWIRNKLLFEFFVNILPSSKLLKEVT
jgi:hypothetical protein